MYTAYPQQPVCWWQGACRIAIFGLFVYFTADWGVFTRLQERNTKFLIFKDSPVYAAKQAELEVFFQTSLASLQVPKFDVRESFRVRSEIIDRCLELDLPAHIYLEPYLTVSQQAFQVNWIPPKYLRNLTETDRSAYASMEFWRSFHFHEGEFPSKLVGPLVTEDGIGILLWILKWYYLLTIPSLIVILLNLVFRRQSVLEKIFMDGRSLILGSLFGPLGLAFNSEAVTATRRYVFLEKKYLRAKPYGYRLTRTEQDALWLQARHELLSFEQALERARHEVVVKPVFACALVWCVSTTGTLTLATLARQALTVVNHLAVACAAEVSSSQDKPHERNGGAPDFMPQALPSAFEFSCFTNVDSVKWFFVWDSAHIRHLIFHESNMARGPPTAVSRSLSHPTSPDCIAEGRSV